MRTLRITEDAYAGLVAARGPGESLNDAIRRLARGHQSLLEFAGDWKDVPTDAMREYLAFLGAADELSRLPRRHQQ
jgi:predicted CopG family antitoxin